MAPKLHNYLRTHRKRSGLSQADVAILLGCKYGTKISRYERQARVPSIETLIALEVVFRTPTRDLFAGVYDDVERQVKRRAKRLLKELKSAPQTPTTKRKVKSLEQIVSSL